MDTSVLPPESTVYLPQLGEGVDQVTVTRWLKAPGDAIEVDEPLLEVATDKVDTEIASTHAGVLAEILVQEEETVEIGAALAVVASSEGAAPDTVVATPKPQVPAPQPVPAAVLPPRQDAPHLSAASETTIEPTPSPAATPKADSTEKLSPVRRTIARRMMESLQISAQLTTVLEVDLSAIARLRSEHKDDFLAHTGVKLSFLPFFARAALDVLPEHRMLNASLNEDVTEVIYHGNCHLGIAVEGPKGLMVPVIRNAGNLGIAQLAQSIAAAAARVRNAAITVEELNGGTFTITNTGSRGALFDTPIINQPQTAILGTGAVVERVVPVRAPESPLRIEVRPMAYLSVSYDHRIVDGADAAKFLTAMKQRLESGYSAADLIG
ncbi:dihydrolipoyllysine-residue succinyltransferase component of 2-oxoglutarate dehydrogenase complex [Mycolicibacterium insubricum]|jgi:2-oxoglutarate dehydrogenase E2 component (dihydrolipoamide succinyltransferase)|uniref:Dihydrolipoamide acetyltransferase component of pyruvate dehydrogenase complex n=1 Tax=Mycolicibacterium insubricum TaxID=444597 RepID=A0A1X0D8G3_9MYCO|nr:2-oxo acid dehydrogenase subunit E2 [Mycolicibacterium insubricum]MCB9440278.1 2-oxo acid dehydrogenase subunit E2 [Mycolicibacterium sp.]ORA68030.1 dihydrolipoyllysine succinyltransferase [Mycolicibacterium insubricum]BBZ66290.1 dihydrolipoyllysine-residue succinyltransferase component of 2-oxoglutarate dehydrogenase complex [Mycolicibacterium insubricum]